MTKTTDMTLQSLIAQYLQSLEAEGKNPRTLYTYGQDCKQIMAYFGPDKKLTKLLPAHVARFYKSDELLKIPRNGKNRSRATIHKTIRVLHMLLRWAMEQEYLSTLPLPKESPLRQAKKSA